MKNPIKIKTDVQIRNLKEKPKRFIEPLGNGLFLRVNPTGKKTFIYRFKFEGKAKIMAIGYYPAISLAKARSKASDASLLKEKGIDPIQKAKDEIEALKKVEQEESETIEWLINDFYNNFIVKNRNAPIQIEQQKNADIIPLIGNFKIKEITRQDIKTLLLDVIVDRGSPVHANKVLRTLKQMFKYAIKSGYLNYSPAIDIDTDIVGGIESSRDRNLNYEEIKAIWTYISDKTKHNTHVSTVLGLKILLLTGVRTGSLIKSEWHEIDFQNNLWTIPISHLKYKKKDKKKKPHKVHLTEFVKNMFTELKSLSGECELGDTPFVFPNKKGDKHVNEKLFSRFVWRSRGKIKMGKPPKEVKVNDYNVHDYRSFISTQMTELKVPLHISELVLGHKLGGILAVYNKHEFFEERKEALELWSDKIEQLVNNNNVLAFEQKKA